MIHRHILVLTALPVCVAMTLSGCQTAGGSAATGAAAGAVAGAIIGHQSGHQGEGAVIGALAGALTGVIVHDIRARKTADANQTAREYEYRQGQEPVVSIEGGSVTPARVRAGDKVTTSVEYALLGTGSRGVQVRETRTLKRNNEVVAEISSDTYTRDDGTWNSAMEFSIPNDLDPGTYDLVHTIETPSARVVHKTTFSVVRA